MLLRSKSMMILSSSLLTDEKYWTRNPLSELFYFARWCLCLLVGSKIFCNWYSRLHSILLWRSLRSTSVSCWMNYACKTSTSRFSMVRTCFWDTTQICLDDSVSKGGWKAARPNAFRFSSVRRTWINENEQLWGFDDDVRDHGKNRRVTFFSIRQNSAVGFMWGFRGLLTF